TTRKNASYLERSKGMTNKQDRSGYGLLQQQETGSGALGLRAISRRHFIGGAAGMSGGVCLRLRLAGRGLAASVPGFSNTSPHILSAKPFGQSLHFYFPGSADSTNPDFGHDPSVINDFNGFVGQADLNLTGTGTDLTTGATGRYAFHTDMRFMKGEFVGADGENHHGAFAFI